MSLGPIVSLFPDHPMTILSFFILLGYLGLFMGGLGLLLIALRTPHPRHNHDLFKP